MSLKVLLHQSRLRGLILWAISEHMTQIAGDIAVTIAFFPSRCLLAKQELLGYNMYADFCISCHHFPFPPEKRNPYFPSPRIVLFFLLQLWHCS